MKFCVLASGSSGNAAFIATETTRLLVDVGLSVKELTARMASIGESPDNLTGILITHEHIDHVSGLPRLIRYLQKRGKHVPVYLTRMAAPAIKWDNTEHPPVEYFKPGASWSIGDVGVDSFTVPHDSVDPLGFCFRAGGVKIGLATDLGFIPDAMRARFRGASAILLESNYDLHMLRTGDYPQIVKDRVESRYGHLSNTDVADYLTKDLDGTVRTLFLGHLSSGNNTQELVLDGAVEVLSSRFSSGRPDVLLANQGKPTEVLEL